MKKLSFCLASCALLVCLFFLTERAMRTGQPSSENKMTIEQAWEKMIARDPLNEFKQKIGYDDLVRKEKRDGLILIDFRKITPPDFVKEWPVMDNPDSWNFRVYEDGRYRFSWDTRGDQGILEITAEVYHDYESARKAFLRVAKASNMYPLPWDKCSKDIGTVCAKGVSRVFFVYKNVFIHILPPNYSDSNFAVVMAEWLFEVLKKHPLTPMLPPGPLVRSPALHPAPEAGHWKPWLLPSVSPKEAPRINNLFPLPYRKGETLPDLGYASPVREHLLWFWVGNDYVNNAYANMESLAELGRQAVQRYIKEQEDLR
ncbi:MAG: hypothetical protein LBC37_05965, partial [Zoogloeaceae bacterium]|nr:hypothetical protein [Zoogloeaceae bacterium]